MVTAKNSYGNYRRTLRSVIFFMILTRMLTSKNDCGKCRGGGTISKPKEYNVPDVRAEQLVFLRHDFCELNTNCG